MCLAPKAPKVEPTPAPTPALPSETPDAPEIERPGGRTGKDFKARKRGVSELRVALGVPASSSGLNIPNA